MSTEAETRTCQRCGASLPSIRGLCAACLARGALERDTGWLRSLIAPVADGASPVIAGWRIVGTLGAGGMGRVYHAESEADGRAAAIKVLDRRWCENPAMIGRLEKEARLLRQLDHENILRLLDTAETDDDRLCLITELVHGCDLGRLLRAETLPPERAMEIFDKVCAAVQHAHERGLVHRDIKPSNILIGRDGAVKLADFGLARETGDDVSVIGGLTATTDQFGTAYYLAPERMRGRCATGPEADVFSLGVLLYHVLSGHMPVGNYRPLSELARVPSQLDAIVARALEADPARRIASVAELRAEVAQLWHDHAAGVLRSRRWRRVASIAVAGLFLVAAAAGGAWWQYQRSRPQPIVFAEPAVATTERPWVNSLGMKFVPVPGTDVLFSVYETRRSDVERFIREVAERRDVPWIEHDLPRLQANLRNSVAGYRDDSGEWTQVTYREPSWEVTPDHPAFCFSGSDAIRYCLWLTWREQGEGRLKEGQHYRLPTAEEWSAACGSEDAALRPGNLAGPEAREGKWPVVFRTNAPGDPFPRTAPVGSFARELHGLFDISGNVSEWVTDGVQTEVGPGQGLRGRVALRGLAFTDGEPDNLNYRYIRRRQPSLRSANTGFRVVLEYKAAPAKEPSK